MGFKDNLQHHLGNKGNSSTLHSSGNISNRNVYPAIVVNIDDPAEQNRIVARIVTLDDKGEVKGGKDRDTPDKNLPFCIPLLSEFLHVRPLVGEMVLLILENPYDNSAPRYWTGPVITSKLKLKYQSYADADSIFTYTNFFPDQKLRNKPQAYLAIPKQADIALQGRDDADIILRQREVIISAGKFLENSFEINQESPCNIQLKQFNDIKGDTVKHFSQQNLFANNINIYSPFGKFRDAKRGRQIESLNEELDYLGQIANSLHPTVFGDELIVLLDLIIKVLLNHIHTPQVSLVETDLSKELSSYSLNGRLQDLISKIVRIN